MESLYDMVRGEFETDDSKQLDEELKRYYKSYTEKLGLTEERIVQLMDEMKVEEIKRSKND